MIIDGHAHLFHPKVISNVKKKEEMVDFLRLQADGAEDRIGVSFLEEELKSNAVQGCFILPTAGAKEVGKVNESSYMTVETSDLLYTAGTLHPEYSDNRQELVKFKQRNIKGIKLCSFSQKFALDDPKTFDMFNLIRQFNITEQSGFFVIIDTLYGADTFFGGNSEHNTTPELLGSLVKNFPEINFIAAHMGGLAAPFNDIYTHLCPMDNLFFDTSNAAHVLEENQFVALLKAHGPEHIIFGTDWPWFTHAPEIDLQHRMLTRAGYSKDDMERVFSKNIIRLSGLAVFMDSGV
ncbi:amidohydrolase family protein [Desulfobacula toluolica]|uniref:Amidohydrolase 2 family protein, related to BamU n=1 Tax=Desulfobacula toluolica (strain DSM 7467 / Tol2) TaxID=651182 RepID=K0NFP8_DESTT|nr:amidohydrolase family protein [Desulfobacula toluolica]CCK78533.1 amidohydrolase 2 family protein, related to BamU [Desulfobacula toluolica Tol2]